MPGKKTNKQSVAKATPIPTPSITPSMPAKETAKTTVKEPKKRGRKATTESEPISGSATTGSSTSLGSNNVDQTNEELLAQLSNILNPLKFLKNDIASLSDDEFTKSLLTKAQILKNKIITIKRLPDNVINNYYDYFYNFREGINQKEQYNPDIWDYISTDMISIEEKPDFFNIFLLVFSLLVIDKPSNHYVKEMLKFFIMCIRSVDQKLMDQVKKDDMFLHGPTFGINRYLTNLMCLINMKLGIYSNVEYTKIKSYEESRIKGTNDFRNYDFYETLKKIMVDYLDDHDQLDDFKTKYLKDFNQLHNKNPKILETIEDFFEDDVSIMEFTAFCDMIPYAMETCRLSSKHE
jgi:hypothetical protein